MTRKLPSNLAAKADEYKLARDKRLALQKEVDKLAEKEKALKNYLIDNLPKSKIGGISGRIARVEVGTKDVPVIENKKVFLAYVRKTKQEDLLTQQLNTAAVRERWADNKEIPGVGKHVVVTLSLHSIKSKR